MLERIAAKIKKYGDLLITIDGKERFYLTKFPSSFGVVVITAEGEGFFFTDKRYLNAARERAKKFNVLEWKSFENLKEIFGNRKVIVDGERVTLKQFNEIEKHFETTTVNGFLKEFRVVKTEEEIYAIARAVAIAEQSLRDVLHLLKPGITEYQFRKELVNRMFHYGSEESFETIVASGKGASIPHWKTSHKEVKDGDVVIVDFGSIFGGYLSDITRTFLIGNVSYELKKIYDTVLEAQLKGIEAAKSGMPCREVDKIVRDFITEKGYGDYFIHGTGHGIGVEIHEAPTLSPKSNEILKKNSVVTVEPGIYIPELGGVRIEDDVLVREDGGYSLITLQK
ncbi:aminopeptidase P family protein [Desulfurobacterium sp.]|uniref:aminopeptidase P family protein n=1 Tax=Desulfurobacterium sp. TaxID=2004706 RepID=UPI0026164450|nr:aminopeptidase P family protein [Desulfurobacterium sp.]